MQPQAPPNGGAVSSSELSKKVPQKDGFSQDRQILEQLSLQIFRFEQKSRFSGRLKIDLSADLFFKGNEKSSLAVYNI